MGELCVNLTSVKPSVGGLMKPLDKNKDGEVCVSEIPPMTVFTITEGKAHSVYLKIKEDKTVEWGRSGVPVIYDLNTGEIRSKGSWGCEDQFPGGTNCFFSWGGKELAKEGKEYAELKDSLIKDVIIRLIAENKRGRVKAYETDPGGRNLDGPFLASEYGPYLELEVTTILTALKQLVIQQKRK